MQPYFCGHSIECLTFGSKAALQRALDNIERYYPVVGVLESLDDTMVVLERALPLFFSDIQELNRKSKGTQTNKHNEQAAATLKDRKSELLVPFHFRNDSRQQRKE